MARINNSTEKSFPRVEVNIYDNTVSQAPAPTVVDGTKLLCVLTSPRGIDSKIQTIQGGDEEFLRKYGFGPFSVYGQPLLNAYVAAQTKAATLHVLRVTAEDSTYSNIAVCAAYKVGDATAEVDANTGSHIPGGTFAGKKLDVRFFPIYQEGITDPKDIQTPITEAELTTAMEAIPALADYTPVHLFTVFCLGRGIYGNNVRIRVSPYARGDKNNPASLTSGLFYKNYTFEVYEGSTPIEAHLVSFYEEAVNNTKSLFVDNVVNNPDDDGSDNIAIYTNTAGFNKIVDAYNAEVLNTIVVADYRTAVFGANSSISDEKIKEMLALSYSDFDVLLGLNRNTIYRATNSANGIIANYVISSPAGTFQLNELIGILMNNGSDGAFAVGTANREEAINLAYKKAFEGGIDGDILSKNLYPTNIIFDANYDTDTKKAIASLAVQRGDARVYFDVGTKIMDKSDVLETASEFEAFVTDRLQSIDTYRMKVVDPYNRKIIDVTSTYYLCFAFPNHFQANNGKHVPLAGGVRGKIHSNGIIPKSIFPVFDEDLDSGIMNQLADSRINYVQINPKGDVYRATQSTRQEFTSNLSEENNMFVILDVKKDCEFLVSQYNYNFLESSDMAMFNRDAEELLLKKYSDTQVKSITATFSSDVVTTERGILHLAVDIQQKEIIKTSIIDININP